MTASETGFDKHKPRLRRMKSDINGIAKMINEKSKSLLARNENTTDEEPSEAESKGQAKCSKAFFSEGVHGRVIVVDNYNQKDME